MISGKRTLLSIFFALILCISFQSAAQDMSLQKIGEIYQKKLAEVGSYRIRYREHTVDKRASATTHDLRREFQLLLGDVGFRREGWVEDSKGGALIPFLIQTNDPEQSRSFSFSADGKSGSGNMRPKLAPMEAYSTNAYTPLGLAGLHDSHSVAPGDTSNFMTDICALAHDTRSRLVEEPVVLDGEKTYVIEWPAGAPQPLLRFWLSADKNLALLKYESLGNSQGRGSPDIQVVNTDFTEVAPGLFLPRKSEFRRAESAALPSQVITLEVISYELGVPVSAEDCRVSFPNGVHVDDRIAGMSYRAGQSPTVEERIEGVTKRMAKSLHNAVSGPSVTVLSEQQASLWGTLAWGLIGLILLSIVSIAIVLVRHARKPLRKNE